VHRKVRAAQFLASFIWSHPANRGKRIRAVCRSVAFEATSRTLRTPKIFEMGDSLMWAHPRFFSSRLAYHATPVNWNEMLAWRRHLKAGDLFIDVGANVGVYTLWASACGADVISLEPSRPELDQLRRNVALNGYSVEILAAAAGAAVGMASMTEDLGAGNHLILERQGEIPVMTIDDVLGDRIAAGMKVDVEGAERLVLDGCRKALETGRIQMLQLEWNTLSQDLLGEDRKPISDMLSAYGYRLCYPDDFGQLKTELNPPSHSGCPDVFAIK
jgi:FkbM family methyltransferase